MSAPRRRRLPGKPAAQSPKTVRGGEAGSPGNFSTSLRIRRRTFISGMPREPASPPRTVFGDWAAGFPGSLRRRGADIAARDEQRHASHEGQGFPGYPFADDEEQEQHEDIPASQTPAGLADPDHTEEIEGDGERPGEAEMIGVPENLVVRPMEHRGDVDVEEGGERAADDEDDRLLLEGIQEVLPVVIAHVGAAGVAQVRL